MKMTRNTRSKVMATGSRLSGGRKRIVDLAASCKDKLAYFRIKELKDVLAQLGLSKQGKKQDLVDRILAILSDDQVSGMRAKKNAVRKKEVAKLVDDTYRITDYLKRHYETHPRPTTGLLPRETCVSATLEWNNMTDIEIDSWGEKVKNMKAEGKTLFSVRGEYYYLYNNKK